MKIKKLLLVLLAVLLVFSLFGCGKKEPVEDVEPQDTTEQLDENISDDISGKPSDNGTYSLTNEEISKEYEYGYMMASAMAQNSVSSLKSKAKENAEKLGLTYSDAQAFDLFAYGEAVSSAEVACSQYVVSFTYPSDGFQQFIDWRKRYESDHGLSASSIGNTGSTGTGEVSNEPDTSDPGAYNGGQPDDTVYDPDAGEDKTDPRLQDNSGIKVGTAYGPDTPMGPENDFSNLPYGFKQ